MTAEQSARLGALYEEYGPQLVQYACRKLMTRGMDTGTARSLAEDIAQEAWIEVARTGAKDLLGPEPLSGGETRAILFTRVKTQIGKHFKRSSSHERPVDWSDPVTCNALCPQAAEQCPLAELPGELSRLIATLPEQEQEALLLRLDGCPLEAIGERLECSLNTGRRLVSSAFLRLQIEQPKLSREPVAIETLPADQQAALARLNEAQRTALLRLDDLPRQVLLLHLGEGLDCRAIASRLGTDRNAIRTAYRCVTSLRPSGTVEGRGLFRQRGGTARVVAETLRRELAGMNPGDQVPSHRLLANRFGWAEKTVRSAMKLLRDEGLIEGGGSGRSYFIASHPFSVAVAA
jgi:RNA polymerase sigma factor (sigma-70 family)